jgi:hypothetical protein
MLRSLSNKTAGNQKNPCTQYFSPLITILLALSERESLHLRANIYSIWTKIAIVEFAFESDTQRLLFGRLR